MLNRAFEWYQVVNPSPSSEVLEFRKASVEALVSLLTDSKDFDLLAECVSATVTGLDHGFTNESPIVAAALGAIRGQQSAFPSDLTDNAVELRVCCALATGEIMARSGADADRGDAVMAASLITSGLVIRPLPAERFLKRMLEELRTSAASVLAREATAKRHQTAETAAVTALEKIPESAALPEFWKNLQKVLKTAFGELHRQSAVDREELNILWWMFSGYSIAAKKPLSDLEPGAAAVCCGVELANLVVLPPIPSTAEMMHRAVASGRKAAALSARPLDQFIKAWDPGIVSQLIPQNADLSQLILAHPTLFPLCWLCRRLQDSEFAAGWADEFERRTGLKTTQQLTPAELASQIFYERVAQRVYLP